MKLCRKELKIVKGGLAQGSVSGCCEHRNRTMGFTKSGDIIDYMSNQSF
jgi:hypothetical protein